MCPPEDIHLFSHVRLSARAYWLAPSRLFPSNDPHHQFQFVALASGISGQLRPPLIPRSCRQALSFPRYERAKPRDVLPLVYLTQRFLYAYPRQTLMPQRLTQLHPPPATEPPPVEDKSTAVTAVIHVPLSPEGGDNLSGGALVPSPRENPGMHVSSAAFGGCAPALRLEQDLPGCQRSAHGLMALIILSLPERSRRSSSPR